MSDIGPHNKREFTRKELNRFNRWKRKERKKQYAAKAAAEAAAEAAANPDAIATAAAKAVADAKVAAAEAEAAAATVVAMKALGIIGIMMGEYTLIDLMQLLTRIDGSYKRKLFGHINMLFNDKKCKFTLSTSDGWFKVTNEGARAFMHLYIKLIQCVNVLSEKFLSMGLNEFECDNPNNEPIVDYALNHLCDLLQFKVMSKNIHFNQLIACSNYQSGMYHRAINYFWKVYVMRVFRHVLFRYTEDMLRSFELTDIFDPPDKTKFENDSNVRHAQFANKILGFICDLVDIIGKKTKILECRKNESFHSSHSSCNPDKDLILKQNILTVEIDDLFEVEDKNFKIDIRKYKPCTSIPNKIAREFCPMNKSMQLGGGGCAPSS
jgi:hypothetical protein